MIVLMYSNYAPTAEHVGRLEHIAGAGCVAVARSDEEAIAAAPVARIVFGHRYLRQLLPHAPGLRWVQTTANGFDQLPWRDLSARGILLTRNLLNSPVVAQHALAMAWALLRRLPVAFAAQARGRWAPAADFSMPPMPRTALVLGLGAIGTQIASRLRGLGVYVRGCARTGSAAQRGACDEFLDRSEWRGALPQTDLLFLALPLDESTRGCIGRAEVAMLPAHAIVASIAREAVVDRAALLEALVDGKIAGAALDGLDPAPAPNDALWSVPNLIVTPKVSAHHPKMQHEFEAFAERQLQRYLLGEALEASVRLEPVPA